MAQKNNKTEAPKKKNRFLRVIIWILVIFGILAVLLIGPRKSFSRDTRVSELEERDLQSVLSKFSNSLTDKDGNLQTKAVVFLSPGELNAMIHALIFVLRSRNICPGMAFDGDWNRSAVGIYGSWYLPGGKGAVNFNLNAVPDLRDNKLKIHISSIGIGNMPLPGFAADALVTSLVNKFTNDPQVQQILEIFERIRVLQDGSVEMVFFPQKVGAFTALLIEGAGRK